MILRVANRTAITKDTMGSGNISSLHFRSQGKSTVGNGIPAGVDPMNSIDANGETPSELHTGVENTIEEISL